MPETHAPWSEGSAHAAGTCGELAQGVLSDGRRFHVSCPIDRGVTVRLRIRPASRTSIHGLAPHAWKADRALRLAVGLVGLGPTHIRVEHHHSRLEEAKGMASSTADVVACVRALAAASAETLSPSAIGRLAASIEPTDAIMHDGVVIADHSTGECLRRPAWTPQFAIAMFVPPATRKTTAGLHPGQVERQTDYAALLDAIDDAVRAEDAAAFASAATRSAVLNEAFVPNPLLQAILARPTQRGALGYCVGHSGTVCGVLFPAGTEGTEFAGAAVDRLLPHLGAATTAAVVQMPTVKPAPASDRVLVRA